MTLSAATPTQPALDRTQLTPVQQSAYDGLLRLLPSAPALCVCGPQGSGKSTVLRALHHRVGGCFLRPGDVLDVLSSRPPEALAETFYLLVRDALESYDAVFVDELGLLQAPMEWHSNPRRGLVGAALAALIDQAAAQDKRLIFADALPCEIQPRCFSWSLQPFQGADYARLLAAFLGDQPAGALDVEKLYKFSPKLNAYQLKTACLWLERMKLVTTAHLLEFLRIHYSLSNVDLEEVQPVAFQDLKGLDDLLDALETHIILPLENDVLATELQLRPKRGVLLAGPPGTGKTTIGRALARRLGSKFFLIDGTVISGTDNFYTRIQQVFNAAKQSGDCVSFIDDSDVIFAEGEETGLYRYLLTMLDGLESKSAGRICVMLTAMNAGDLPPALVRSGRVELWLETRLPTVEARRAILEAQVQPVRAALGPIDTLRLAQETDGLTGADLKRLVEDGKLLFAREKAEGRTPAEPTAYLLSALASFLAHRERYLANRAAGTA